MSTVSAALLDPIVKRDPVGPRITYYDDATGERIEVSAVTLANWAAKTANLLQDELGQVREAHSISAGLDYPGVGPEHSFLKDQGRASYVTATDDEALAALERLARSEGIIPALETAHAVAHAIRLAPTMSRDESIVVSLSGRGDKDMETVAQARGVELRSASHGNGAHS